MNGINKRKYFLIENNINMKNKTYKSRSCKETVDINSVARPITGRFKNVDGKEIFINKEIDDYIKLQFKTLKESTIELMRDYCKYNKITMDELFKLINKKD